MQAQTLKTWIARRISVRTRLEQVCVNYLLFLMVATLKHSFTQAARFSGLSKSAFCKLLRDHCNVAAYTLDDLSKKQARQFAKCLHHLTGLPWKIAILVDSTIQHRASLHPENAKKFNHGKGYVIGHQWTNVILVINDILIPLPPIPFYSKPYCREHGLDYQSEHDLVVAYLTNLHLEDYIGSCDPGDVIVLADSGYDNKKIENAIIKKHWNFIIALGKTRSVKSEALYLTTPKSRQWCHIATFFRNHRRLKWQTVRFMTNGAKRKRMEFRIRHTLGYLRYVGQVQLVCSEFKRRPDGRRKYLACSDVRVTARQIVLGYRLRWAVEIFHKNVKQHLGFEDVATTSFDSVKSHVHWVYCAYILLHMSPPGVAPDTTSLGAKQRQIQQLLEDKEKRRVLQKLTQIGGVERYKVELRQALAAA
ncbi:MAG: transposase [Gammaproteobacteria bacterium]|nr:transposase [Gammaproteobacteria bacterium]